MTSPISSRPDAVRPRGRLAWLLSHEAASGLLLLGAAGVALLWASSPWAGGYRWVWQTPLTLRLGSFEVARTLEWLVNDGLMVVFFFVVGLEIRRELHDGELADFRRAALPAAAALGGMLAPALIYLAFVTGPSGRAGWGVPMATDIAFAVGILSLLGKRVPPSLRILLLALAVIDDLGAILVIALFYSTGVQPMGLVVALSGLVAVKLMQRGRIEAKLAYVLPALVVWAGVYRAGIHPTIAGVALGLMTPVRAPHGGVAPAHGLVRTLQPWVAFGIMPVFALANAGVSLQGLAFDAASSSIAFSVAAGLLLGKPAGVLAAIALCLRLGLASLPAGIGARHLIVLGVVAGVGFTMALFIAQLAFTDAQALAAGKLGVLVGSAVAGVLTLVLGRALLPRPTT